MILALLPLLAAPACETRPEPAAVEGLARKRARQAELEKRFLEAATRDPLVAEAQSDEGQVVLALRASFLQRALEDVAQSYLDRVGLDRRLNAKVDAEGEARVDSRLLGEFTAGAWRVHVEIPRVRAVLRAGRPVLRLPAADRIALEMPVTLLRGEGSATIHFAWSARGLAGLACHDFELTRVLRGIAVSETYTLSGALVLGVEDNAILARPDFPDTRVRLRVGVPPETWREVREALEEQRALSKCGLALKFVNAETMLEKLEAVMGRGFDVRIPQKLFRPFRLPVRVEPSLTIEGHRLAMRVKPHAVRTAHDALWLSAGVEARGLPAPLPP
ncbi:MAG TPA: hypothetical protein VKI41_15785 [Vicinamibacteria bacterium]|nr:hypothetical protein [Vicinamibacteria bacterium]